ncbi:hypothetical protein D3C75_1297600 [compost metagenome]
MAKASGMGLRTARPSAKVFAEAVSHSVPVSNDNFAARASVDTTPTTWVFRPKASRAAMTAQIPEPQPIGT